MLTFDSISVKSLSPNHPTGGRAGAVGNWGWTHMAGRTASGFQPGKYLRPCNRAHSIGHMLNALTLD